MKAALLGALGVLLAACGAPEPKAEEDRCEEPIGVSAEALSPIDCTEHSDTGYVDGNPFPITVVTVDGKPAEVQSANAYYVMAQAADAAGVTLKVNSGFRTYAEQQYLYNCYINCNCNNCNLAAKPGYSNHQSGHAFDLNTSSGGVYNWLEANAANFGFKRTVPSEAWHWEWWGGGPGGGPCGSCDRKAGGFTFSCDGEETGQHCVNVNEPGDPDTWSDNYFCSALDLGMQWSSSGPIADMDCTAVVEPSEPEAVWGDNHLCLPKQSPFSFSYSNAGPIAGKSCVHWNEPADAAGSWGDNHVCFDPVYAFSAGGFTFSGAGPIDGKHCILVDEPSDPDTWNDNYFCSDEDVGMQWSFAGPIDGMDCTNVIETGDGEASMWTDNYLCLPRDATYRFTWSFAGPVDGQTCVRWFEHSENTAIWIDNWMCIEDLAPPSGSGGGSAAGGSGGGGSGAGSGAGGSNADPTPPDGEDASGCACRMAGTSTNGGVLWLAAALVVAGLRRRR